LATGSLLGLVVGFGMAGAAEMRDPFFLGPADVVHTLDMPILTQVPRLGTGRNGAEVAIKHNSRLAPVLSAFHRPRSREAEAIRGLRTAIFFRLSGSNSKVIQLTSANPGDGKTTVAANLSVSIAQAGQRTLLVDCDMRRPSVHKIFGLDSKDGLASVLGGDLEPGDAILATEVPNLSVLPCGSLPTNPAELLTNKKFTDLLALLRERYDCIVLDTPPLLAVADPAIVAAHADGVAIAIRLTRDSRMQVIRSKELLVASKAKLVGVVINGYDLTRRHRLATYAYGYSYGYGYGKQGRYGGYGDAEVSSDNAMKSYYVEEEEGEHSQETNGKASASDSA